MLTTPEQTGQSSKGLLVAALVIVAAMAAAFAIFYHFQDHPPVEVTAGRLVPMPIHTTYTHVGRVIGPDQTEDSLYVLAEVKVRDRADTPLFVKDIHGTFITKDGGTVSSRRIGSEDLDRLYTLLPQLKPAVQGTGLKQLEPEQTIPKDSAADGYVLLLFAAPTKAWEQRQSAQIEIGFYHQDSVTLILPK